MPVYNCEKTIKIAIDSILNQSFKEFELIIIDDGSSDRTVDIINDFNDPRIFLYKNKTNKTIVFDTMGLQAKNVP